MGNVVNIFVIHKAYSYKPGSPWAVSHQLSLNGKRDHFKRADLLAVAQIIGNFGAAGDIINEIIAVVKKWPKYAKMAAVDEGFVTAIAENLRLDIK